VVKTTELLEARLANVQDQIEELESLRGKNRDVVADIMFKVNQETQQFDKGISQFKALRTIFSHHSGRLRKHLGMQRLQLEVRKTRSDMDNSRFSREMRDAMLGFFSAMKGNLSKANHQVDEIQTMMNVMYQKFSSEHGLASVNPPSHNLVRFHKEIDRLERIFNERFNTVLQMLTQGQRSLTAKFFETLASRVVHVFEIANRETEAWLKALIAPMETQVREHQMQLKRRLESVQRIHDATETLEERIRELGANADATSAQIEHMARLNSLVSDSLADIGDKTAAMEKSA
jgi:ubiquinone biosynthesis protein UbiJ